MSGRLIKRMVRERFLVTLESDETFDGLLLEHDEQHLVLGDAEQVAPNGDRMKVDGQLWLPRFNVRYMQRPRA